VSKSLPVCGVEVASLSCQSRRFTVLKSPVYRIEIAASLPYRNRRFAVSKLRVTGKKKVLDFDKNKKNIDKLDQNNKKVP